MPSKTQSVLLGGLIAGILGTSYLGLINVLCCAGFIIGGIAAVWHYTSTYNLTLAPGQGATIGAMAAAVGGIIAGVLTYLLEAIGLPSIQEAIMGFYEGNLSPEQMEQISQQQAQSPVMLFVYFLVALLVYTLFGAVGGAIGASLFKKGGETPTTTTPETTL